MLSNYYIAKVLAHRRRKKGVVIKTGGPERHLTHPRLRFTHEEADLGAGTSRGSDPKLGGGDSVRVLSTAALRNSLVSPFYRQGK